MSETTVHNQDELDKAIEEGVDWIDIKSEAGVWLPPHNSFDLWR